LTFNLDVASARARMTPNTVAVLPVHVFGQPCDTAGFAALAREHGVAMVYDAAHAFGSRVAGGSACNAGVSVLSFQATKVFQTAEGGAVVLESQEQAAWLRRSRIFGLGQDAQIH